MSDEKVRENRLRRMATRQGLVLKRSPRRDPRAYDFGGYMIVVGASGFPVLGNENGLAFAADLDDVEAFLLEGSREEAKTRMEKAIQDGTRIFKAMKKKGGPMDRRRMK